MKIFDQVNKSKIVERIKKIYVENKEILMYLFFGGLTFVISIASYSILCVVFSISELISNVISWILAVTFAYITNRKWVFISVAKGYLEVFKEAVLFYLGRVATLVVEEIILFVFIILLNCNSIVTKVVAQVIVIVLNYVISKVAVFKDK